MSARRRSAVSLTVGGLLASGCSLQLHPASLTFRIDAMECSPAATSTVCSFFAYYGNVGGHPVQVEPSTTRVVDRTGQSFAPVAEAETGGSFLLKPGQQQQISWSVTLPTKLRPAKVTWHGSKAPVFLNVGPVASASPLPSVLPSASIGPSLTPSLTPSPTPGPPSVTPLPTTTAPPTTTKPVVKPTTTKPKPPVTTTTVKPTTIPPTTPPPPPPTTTHPPTHRTSAPPTTNSTNPGGGSGGIG